MIISRTLSFGQETETVLSSPENWRSEIIPFPLEFAPQINLVGFEEIRFAPGWPDSNSLEFWTYTFVWYTEKSEALTENKLTKYFSHYFDGLMKVDVQNENDTTGSQKIDKTICLFLKSEKGFNGKIRVYDNFFTKDYLILNIMAKEYFCPELNKQIIRYDISPKDFNHKVWDKFDGVNLKIKCE